MYPISNKVILYYRAFLNMLFSFAISRIFYQFPIYFLYNLLLRKCLSSKYIVIFIHIWIIVSIFLYQLSIYLSSLWQILHFST